MQGVHAFDPKVTVSIDLESFVAADHFLRRVDRVLDLSFVRELTAPRYAVDLGRPSITIDGQARLAGTNPDAPNTITASVRAGTITLNPTGAFDSVLQDWNT